jgi:glycosyltransferase involved in cell wall biosynthesis
MDRPAKPDLLLDDENDGCKQQHMDDAGGKESEPRAWLYVGSRRFKIVCKNKYNTPSEPPNRRMRLLFVVIGNEGRNGPVHGDSIRRGGVGASGTDQSSIMVGEWLASKGHDVVIAAIKTEPGHVCHGVTYTDLSMTGVEDRTFDVLFTMLWFADLEALPVTVSRAIVVVQHMQYLYSCHEISEFARKRGLRIGAMHVSQWECDRTRAALDCMAPGIVHAIAPNPVMIDIADEVVAEGLPRAEHDIIFTAAWNRGAELLKHVFLEQLDWEDGHLVCCDYTRCNLSHYTDPRIRELGSTDKVSVMRALARAKYFVYACVNAGPGCMHYDTFGVCVAEALAMGVNVVCYPLGALPEAFDGCLQIIPFPPGVDEAALAVGAVGCEPRLFDAAWVASHVARLDADPERQAELRAAGMRHVREMYGIEKVGPMWEAFLAELCPP